MTNYRVTGFKRDDDAVKVTVFVDGDLDTTPPIRVAEALAGPDYCFVSSSPPFHPVPESAKGRLFFSDKEIRAAIPELRRRRGGAS